MDPIFIGKAVTTDTSGSAPSNSVFLLPKYGNRHGLVAGATGTGKTVTLMTLAEGFSRMGVPVFMADVKGDVAGLATAGDGSERVMQRAKDIGATRICMGAAWKHPSAKDMPYVLEMVKGVKAMGLETCMTLGRLDQDQTEALAQAGLDYYNHNLDTSPEFYGSIITTRTYSERLQTLAYVRDSGMKICSGGILGMGESLDDRANLLIQLANLPEHPESVPINMLVKVKGTPLAEAQDVDPFDFIRMLAVARIMMPKSHVRLSAGREAMNEQMQALAFMAGANSIFYGEKLLTTRNPQADKDMQLFGRLGIKPEEREEHADEVHQAAIEQALVEQRDSKLFYDAASA